MKRLTYIIILLIATSCSNSEIKRIKGSWTIDSIERNGQDMMFLYTSNLVTFKKQHECTLPQSRENNVTDGKWKLNKEDETYYIEIELNGSELAGKYKVNLKNDTENQLLKMYLLSDSTEIICSKLLNNFDE